MSKTRPVTTTPLVERILRAKTPEDLLLLIGEVGRLTDPVEAHRHADDILMRLCRMLARRHPDEKTATEVARRWTTIDKRYCEP